MEISAHTARIATVVVLLSCAMEAQVAESEKARELLNSGHAAEAAALYRELASADPRNAGLLLNLSIAEYRAGMFAEAAASAAGALALNPELVPARLFLGASYLEMGVLTKAVDALERVVSSDPGERNARLMLGEALLRSNRPQAAMEHLQLVSGMLPANPRVWYALGRTYESLGQQDAASEAWKRLMALPPSVQLYTHLAERNEAERRWVEAARDWREALKLQPDDTAVRVKLAWALFRKRDYAEAMSALKPLLSVPDNAEVPFLYGASWLNLQQPEKAIPFLRDALLRDTGSLPAHAALGQALIQTGKPEEAIPLLERALPGDRDGSVHFQLFRAYQLTGQSAKAQQALAAYRRFRASLSGEP